MAKSLRRTAELTVAAFYRMGSGVTEGRKGTRGGGCLVVGAFANGSDSPSVSTMRVTWASKGGSARVAASLDHGWPWDSTADFFQGDTTQDCRGGYFV